MIFDNSNTETTGHQTLVERNNGYELNIRLGLVTIGEGSR
jgi:hypothetical protein